MNENDIEISNRQHRERIAKRLKERMRIAVVGGRQWRALQCDLQRCHRAAPTDIVRVCHCTRLLVCAMGARWARCEHCYTRICLKHGIIAFAIVDYQLACCQRGVDAINQVDASSAET